MFTLPLASSQQTRRCPPFPLVRHQCASGRRHSSEQRAESPMSPRPQDRAVDAALHDAAFVADQLDPIALDARHMHPQQSTPTALLEE